MQYFANLQYPYYSQMLMTFINFADLVTSYIVFISLKITENHNLQLVHSPQDFHLVFLLEKKDAFQNLSPHFLMPRNMKCFRDSCGDNQFLASATILYSLKTLENMFKVHNKNARTTSVTPSFWCFQGA